MWLNYYCLFANNLVGSYLVPFRSRDICSTISLSWFSDIRQSYSLVSDQFVQYSLVRTREPHCHLSVALDTSNKELKCYITRFQVWLQSHQFSQIQTHILERIRAWIKTVMPLDFGFELCWLSYIQGYRPFFLAM